jgi:hypothetical protein
MNELLSTGSSILYHSKHAGHGIPREIPSGPVWVDRSGISAGQAVKRAPLFGPDRVIYAYPALHYPKALNKAWSCFGGVRLLTGPGHSLRS